jgi:hypothetical protein
MEAVVAAPDAEARLAHRRDSTLAAAKARRLEPLPPGT